MSYAMDLATETDLPRIAALWLAMVNETYPDGKPNAMWWMEQARKFHDTGAYWIVVNRDEHGKVNGFIDFMIHDEPATSQRHACVMSYYVLPEYRSKGKIAYALMKTAHDIAKLEKCTISAFTTKKPRMWTRKGFILDSTVMKGRI